MCYCIVVSTMTTLTSIPDNSKWVADPHFWKRYTLGDNSVKLLGTGTFGKVVLATHTKSNESVAVKLLTKVEGNVNVELVALQRLSRRPHCARYIVCYYEHKRVPMPQILREHYDSKENAPTELYAIVMEFVSNIELLEYIFLDHEPEYDNIENTLLQCLRGMKTIHDNDMAHSDIKPDNIMVKVEPKTKRIKTVKYIDFGLACMSRVCHLRGNIPYMSPSLFMRGFYKIPLSLKEWQENDIWALGACFYEWLTGVPIISDNFNFKDTKKLEGLFAKWTGRSIRNLSRKSQVDIHKTITNVRNQLHVLHTYGVVGRLVNQMLNVIPHERPSIEVMIKAIERKQKRMAP